MTLVVCKTVGPYVFVLADTRITKNQARLPPSQGVIKTAILSEHACVSFSHSSELAVRDIAKFRERHQGAFTNAEAIDFFTVSSRETNNDYILAFLEPLCTFLINDGNVIERKVGHQSWIGDNDAFKRFRAYLTHQRRGPNVWEMTNWPKFGGEAVSRELDNLISAFRLTLRDHQIPSAGDFLSIVTNKDSKFAFLPLTNLFFDGHGPRPLIPLSGENFDYRFSVLAPLMPGINACAFYYPHAKTGYIFYAFARGLAADRCISCENKSEADFQELCKATTGAEFNFLTTSHVGPQR